MGKSKESKYWKENEFARKLRLEDELYEGRSKYRPKTFKSKKKYNRKSKEQRIQEQFDREEFNA